MLRRDLVEFPFNPTPTLLLNPSSSHLFLLTLHPSKTQGLPLPHPPPLPPPAGTLVWPPESDEPYIRVDDEAAISLTVAKSDADFHRLSGRGLRGSAESHPLIPHLPASETELSIMALQITEFPDVGFCIGISSTHAVVDGKTSTMFLKSWASICRLGEGSEEITPSYDRTVIRDPKGIKTVLLGTRQKLLGPKSKTVMPLFEPKPPEGAIRGTFVLTRAQIEKLREKCSERQKHEHMVPTRVSTFALTCADTWACLIKTRRIEKNTIYFGFAADLRSRWNPPIPETYFGNCIRGCLANLAVSELESEGGVSMAAEAISEAIRKLKERGYPDEPEEWISVGNVFRTGNVTTVAGSPLFGLYGTDFGWGRPRKVEVASIDRTGAIALSDSRDGDGGVEVDLVLDEPKMETFASLFANGLRAQGP